MGKFIDETGNKYGYLTVIERHGTSNDKQAIWKCKCICGKEHLVKGRDLRDGVVRSCGCKTKNMFSEARKTHGMSNSRLYGIWLAMKRRCDCKNCRGYHLYGGRGIKVCDEWLDKEHGFENFYTWSISNGYIEEMGNDGRNILSIDRIDVNGNYEPSNCRWVDMVQQSNNRRDNHVLYCDGEYHTISEWAKITGIKRATIERRINKYGFSVDDALKNRAGTRHKIDKNKLKQWKNFYSKTYARMKRGKTTREEFEKIIDKESINF